MDYDNIPAELNEFIVKNPYSLLRRKLVSSDLPRELKKLGMILLKDREHWQTPFNYSYTFGNSNDVPQLLKEYKVNINKDFWDVQAHYNLLEMLIGKTKAFLIKSCWNKLQAKYYNGFSFLKDEELVHEYRLVFLRESISSAKLWFRFGSHYVQLSLLDQIKYIEYIEHGYSSKILISEALNIGLPGYKEAINNKLDSNKETAGRDLAPILIHTNESLYWDVVLNAFISQKFKLTQIEQLLHTIRSSSYETITYCVRNFIDRDYYKNEKFVKAINNVFNLMLKEPDSNKIKYFLICLHSHLDTNNFEKYNLSDDVLDVLAFMHASGFKDLDKTISIAIEMSKNCNSIELSPVVSLLSDLWLIRLTKPFFLNILLSGNTKLIAICINNLSEIIRLQSIFELSEYEAILNVIIPLMSHKDNLEAIGKEYKWESLRLKRSEIINLILNCSKHTFLGIIPMLEYYNLFSVTNKLSYANILFDQNMKTYSGYTLNRIDPKEYSEPLPEIESDPFIGMYLLKSLNTTNAELISTNATILPLGKLTQNEIRTIFLHIIKFKGIHLELLMHLNLNKSLLYDFMKHFLTSTKLEILKIGFDYISHWKKENSMTPDLLASLSKIEIKVMLSQDLELQRKSLFESNPN